MRTNYASGTWLSTSGPWDVFRAGRALCPDGTVRMLKRIAITADTYFSIPASVTVAGKTVSGWVSVTDTSDPSGNGTANDPECTVIFHGNGRNGDAFAAVSPRTFYVAYFGQGFPGEQASDPTRHASIAAVKRAFREFARAVGRDYYDAYGTAHASVYGVDSADAWTEAERFAGIGCPFDYPSFTLSIGKRGGTVRQNA
jgi:hypothetical protein